MIEIVSHRDIATVKSTDLYNFIMKPWVNHYSQWWIDNGGYGNENIDFFSTPVVRMGRGRPRKVYLLTLDFAIDLCILSRTKNGKVLKGWLKEEQIKRLLYDCKGK